MRPTPAPTRFSHSLLRRLAFLWLPPLSAAAQTAVWQGPSQSEWADAANWSPETVPNADGTAVSFTNSAASGTGLTIGLGGAPFTVSALTVANASPDNSVILGSSATDTDILTLSTPGATPRITVSSGTLKVNARLEGGGFIRVRPPPTSS